MALGKEGYAKVCVCCGKTFIISNTCAQYLYKDTSKGKHKYYCSYTCWNKNKPEKANRRRYY